MKPREAPSTTGRGSATLYFPTLALLFLLTLANLAQTAGAAEAAPEAGVVRMSVSRAPAAVADEGSETESARTKIRAARQARDRPLVERAGTITESLGNNVTGGSYMANVSIGTPGQAVSLVLDTGSSDVYVLDFQADECTNLRLENEFGPCVGGTYNPSKSSSYKLLQQGGFEIQYADGSGSAGDYISETFAIGGSTVSSLQMGLAFNTTTSLGIMGIGPDADEASQNPYPNLIDQMVSQNLISSKAYSLYLDDLEASTGSILFGGVDTSKYTGTLASLPIQADSQTGTISSFSVALTSITLSTSSSSSGTSLTGSNFAQAAILDSGTTFTYLPDNVVETLLSAFGNSAVTDRNGDVYVDCTLLNSQPGMTFDFGFGGSQGPVVKVPLSEMLFNLDGGVFARSLDGSSSSMKSSWLSRLVSRFISKRQHSGGSGGSGSGSSGSSSSSSGNLPFSQTCILGISASGTGSDAITLLGDTFLRSAYVVYDLANNQIALAQTNFNSTSSSNVQTIGSGAIPGASSVPSGGVTVVQSITSVFAPGIGGGGGHASATASGGLFTLSGAQGTVTVTQGGTGAAATSSTSKAAAASSMRGPAWDGSLLAVLGVWSVAWLVGGAGWLLFAL